MKLFIPLGENPATRAKIIDGLLKLATTNLRTANIEEVVFLKYDMGVKTHQIGTFEIPRLRNWKGKTSLLLVNAKGSLHLNIEVTSDDMCLLADETESAVAWAIAKLSGLGAKCSVYGRGKSELWLMEKA